jgi:ribonuclease Z
MIKTSAKVLLMGASLLAGAPLAHAAPCLIVTITGSQGGPQAYEGQAGPGTLISYGDADLVSLRLPSK